MKIGEGYFSLLKYVVNNKIRKILSKKKNISYEIYCYKKPFEIMNLEICRNRQRKIIIQKLLKNMQERSKPLHFIHTKISPYWKLLKKMLPARRLPYCSLNQLFLVAHR